MHMHRILGAGAALLATSVLAAPLDLGLNLSTLNKCLFSDPLTKLRLDATKVLDLSSNTCLSTTACLATKTNQIVTQTVAGVLQVPVCQRKTCPEGVTLNSEGLCVCLDAKVLVGSASSAYCAPAPKTCQDNLVLVSRSSNASLSTPTEVSYRALRASVSARPDPSSRMQARRSASLVTNATLFSTSSETAPAFQRHAHRANSSQVDLPIALLTLTRVIGRTRSLDNAYPRATLSSTLSSK